MLLKCCNIIQIMKNNYLLLRKAFLYNKFYANNI